MIPHDDHIWRADRSCIFTNCDARRQDGLIGPCETHHDPVTYPSHYNSHPSGVECITVVEHMGFNLGNAIKYIWRADEKGNAIEDLRKSLWYIEREIARRDRGTGQ